MRISLIPADRGYDPTHARRVKRVLIDGQEALTPITADEEEGFVLQLTSDGLTGKPKVDPVSGEYILTRRNGKVQIELLPPGERDWDKSRKGETKVAVARDTNGDLLVQVYSLSRPGAIKQGRLPVRNLPASQAAICQAAGTMAGAVAEALCEQFGDRIDPSACAATAVRECHRMLTSG